MRLKTIIIIIAITLINLKGDILKLIPAEPNHLPHINIGDTVTFAIVTEINSENINGISFYLEIPEESFQVLYYNDKPFKENNYFNGSTVFTNKKLQKGIYGYSEASLNEYQPIGLDTVCWFRGIILKRNEIILPIKFSAKSPYKNILSSNTGETVNFTNIEHYSLIFSPKEIKKFIAADYPADTGGKILIQWSFPAETPGFMKGINLYKIKETGSELIYQTSSLSVLTFIDSNTTTEDNQYFLKTYHQYAESLSSDTLNTEPLDNRPSGFNLIEPQPLYQLKTAYSQSGMPFSWSESIDPDNLEISYKIYLSLDTLFSNIIYENTTSNTEISIAVPYLENQSLFWKVEANDKDGFIIPSEKAKFYINVISESPEPVYCLSPIHLSKINQLYPLFQWTSSSDNDPLDQPSYQFSLSEDNNFSQLITQITISDTFYQYEQHLNKDQIYYWKITATDSIKPFESETQNFIYSHELQPPSSFQIISPDNMTNISSIENLLFQWSKSIPESPYDSVTYEIKIGQDTNYFSLYQTIVKDTFYMAPASDFQDNKIYYWNITAKDSKNQSRKSEQTYLFYKDTENQTPMSFYLLQPYDNIILPNNEIQFSWNKSFDYDPFDTLTYFWTLFDYTFFPIDSEVIVNDTFMAYSKILNENEQYYWSVSVSDKEQMTASSYDDYFTFYLNSIEEPPESFSLLNPKNDTILKNQNIQFEWEKSSDFDPLDSVYYRFEYSIDSNFLFCNDTILSDSTVNLNPNLFISDTAIFWRVAAVDNTGNSTFSTETFRFLIDNKKPGLKYILIQEKLFPQYLKIFIQSSERLKSNPFIRFNGTDLSVSITDTNYNIYYTSVKLPILANPYQLDIKGTDLSDNEEIINDMVYLHTNSNELNKINPLNITLQNHTNQGYFISHHNSISSDTSSVCFQIHTLSEEEPHLTLITPYPVSKNAVPLTAKKTINDTMFYTINQNGTYELDRKQKKSNKQKESIHAYPNPWNEKIQVHIKNNGTFTLKLYNTLGEETGTIFKDQVIQGQKMTILSSREYALSSGIYFLALYNEKQLIEIKKIVLIK